MSPITAMTARITDYCITEEIPPCVAFTLMALVTRTWRDETELLNKAHHAWVTWGQQEADDFMEAVRVATNAYCQPCNDCQDMHWEENLRSVEGRYGPEQVCENCIDRYWCCNSCEGYFNETTTVESGAEYCESCLSEYCSYCDECETWYNDEDSDEHSHGGCGCEVAHPQFQFPANGDGTVAQNERLAVELPKGTIDDVGLDRIRRLIRSEVYNSGVFIDIPKVISEVGPVWQTKRGNFTRRLSSALHKHKIKLSAETISQVGNLARQHSSDGASWDIEFTRDLNLSAEDFYHDDSCWWGSHSESRCCLKSWGGLGLRSFSSDYYNSVSGRAWVQPLNAELKPTHDTLGAHAYVVYNGYGDLEGYTATRIVAHLTGHTYKRITFSAYNCYVNDSTGYLVADEATCASTDIINFDLGSHDRLDAHTFTTNRSAA